MQEVLPQLAKKLCGGCQLDKRKWESGRKNGRGFNGWSELIIFVLFVISRGLIERNAHDFDINKFN